MSWRRRVGALLEASLRGPSAPAAGSSSSAPLQVRRCAQSKPLRLLLAINVAVRWLIASLAPPGAAARDYVPPPRRRDERSGEVLGGVATRLPRLLSPSSCGPRRPPLPVLNICAGIGPRLLRRPRWAAAATGGLWARSGRNIASMACMVLPNVPPDCYILAVAPRRGPQVGERSRHQESVLRAGEEVPPWCAFCDKLAKVAFADNRVVPAALPVRLGA